MEGTGEPSTYTVAEVQSPMLAMIVKFFINTMAGTEDLSIVYETQSAAKVGVIEGVYVAVEPGGGVLVTVNVAVKVGVLVGVFVAVKVGVEVGLPCPGGQLEQPNIYTSSTQTSTGALVAGATALKLDCHCISLACVNTVASG